MPMFFFEINIFFEDGIAYAVCDSLPNILYRRLLMKYCSFFLKALCSGKQPVQHVDYAIQRTYKKY